MLGLRHGGNDIDAFTTVTAPPTGIVGPPSGSLPDLSVDHVRFATHALNKAVECRLPRAVARRQFDCRGRPRLVPPKRRHEPTLDANVLVFNSVNRLVHNGFCELTSRHSGSCRRWSSVIP